ncbi:MAG: bifunctional DNA primase/polymerase [Nitrospiraceae bacterium]|nr:bifunctional DNA primase/polymerase [Nitrospiraceae bacterium]
MNRNLKQSAEGLPTLDWARSYLSRGFSIIPVTRGTKRPALSSWKEFQERRATDEEIRAWFGNGSRNGIGIVTGVISGIAVVDLDGPEAVEFAKAHGFPPTPLVKTGKGYHAYYRYSAGVRNFQKRDDLPGIDLRGDGGYVVAPPSVHASGNRYQWVEGKGLDDLPLAELPSMILAQRPQDKTPLRDLYKGVLKGSRNGSLTRLVGSWVADGVPVDECLRMAQLWNSQNEPPDDIGNVERTVRSIFEKHHSKTVSGLVRLDSVQPEKVQWLWHSYIPLGKITLIDGDPGNGKSLFAIDLIARVTKGLPMPDGSTGASGGAVILALEDGLADTIVPRLEAAGGDKSQVAALQGIADAKGNLRLPTISDIDHIARACDEVQARLLVIDPLMAYMGDVNSWKDQDIRQGLAPLVRMAEEKNDAVLVIRHLNKSSASHSVYRGGGSIGFIGLARMGFLIAKDPDNEDKRIVAGIKCNLAPLPPSLTYVIENHDGVPKIAWGGACNHTADALLAAPQTPEERSAFDEAKDFLLETLSAGSVNANEVLRQAKRAGISGRTLMRAKKALAVRSEKPEFGGGWVWRLSAEECQESPKDANKYIWHSSANLASFAESGPQKDNKSEVINVLEVKE